MQRWRQTLLRRKPCDHLNTMNHVYVCEERERERERERESRQAIS